MYLKLKLMLHRKETSEGEEVIIKDEETLEEITEDIITLNNTEVVLVILISITEEEEEEADIITIVVEVVKEVRNQPIMVETKTEINQIRMAQMPHGCNKILAKEDNREEGDIAGEEDKVMTKVNKEVEETTMGAVEEEAVVGDTIPQAIKEIDNERNKFIVYI